MNIATIVICIIIGLLLFLAVRSILQSGSFGCGGNCKMCGKSQCSRLLMLEKEKSGTNTKED